MHGNLLLNRMLFTKAEHSGEEDCNSLVDVLANRITVAGHTWGTPLFGAGSNTVNSNTREIGNSLASTAEDLVSRSCSHDDWQLPFDTVLASDVVYYPEGYRPLLDSLLQLLTPRPPSSCRQQLTSTLGEGAVLAACGSASCGSADGGGGGSGTTAARDVAASCSSADRAVDSYSDADLVYPICILAHRHRHPEDHLFFDMVAHTPNLVVEKIDFCMQQQKSRQQQQPQQQSASSVVDGCGTDGLKERGHGNGDGDGDGNATWGDVLLFKLYFNA